MRCCPHAIPIYGTIWALLLAYISLGTPLSVRIMSSAYGQLSFDLEECSRVHGGSWLQTMGRIVIALAWPSFAVGWVLVFFGIMRELSASVLLYSVGSEVLSVVLLKLWANGNAEQVSVIGLLMMVHGDPVQMGSAQGHQEPHQCSVNGSGNIMSNVILEKVSRNFGQFVAVDGVDLRVNEGEFVTLLGPSGCGKTTTLRMVAGLEQNTGGRISIGNEIVSDAARGIFVPSERRRLGMVFQSYAIWPHMTVFDNVAYPLRVRRRPAAEILDRVTKALQLVEMEGFAQRPAPALSGGQQQRVAIARALVFEPTVLLLDEPLSNLDAKLRLQMGDEFRSIQKRLGMTSLYVTHDQSEAMALSDRVVVMDRGRIQQIGAPEDIYRYPANRTVAAFFGTPNLLEASVESCARVDERRFRLEVVGRGWRGPCEAASEVQPGQAVTVMARPEDARLAPAGSKAGADELTWSGRIAHTIFRGPIRSIVVQTDDGRLNVDAPPFGSHAIGDNVTVVVPQRAAWAVVEKGERAQ